MARLCNPEIEYSEPLASLELWEPNILGVQNYLEAFGGTGNKKAAALNAKIWINKAGPLDILLYTDGSQEYDKIGNPIRTGAAWIIQWVGSWFRKGGTALGTSQEVYDTEALAMTQGLEIALTSPMAAHAPAIHIYLNNLSVVQNVGKILNRSSQATFVKFRELAKSWLAKDGKALSVQWVPGHEDIKRNKLVDNKARKYANETVDHQFGTTQSLSNAKRHIRKLKDKAWQSEWENQQQTGAPLLYLELGLKPFSKQLKLAPQLNIKCEILGWLIVARSGHGHFAAYHQRFAHKEDEDWRYSYGKYRAALYSFQCTNARAHRALLCPKKPSGLCLQKKC